MLSFLKKISSNGWLPAVVMVSVTAALTFGLLIPRLGYYHDDWFMIWSGVSRGAGSLFSLFSSDRPFMGFIYVRLFGIIGESIPGWHLAALAARIAGAMAFYWILRLSWPKLKNVFVLAALLFITFPGFLSQPNAATKINHLIGYGAALFSIAFALQAAVTDRKVWKVLFTGAAMLSTAFYLWIYEYMVGLELMRAALLFWLYWQRERGRALAAVKKAALAYLPYVPVVLAFLYWRIFVFESTRVSTNVTRLMTQYQGDAANIVIRLGLQGVKDFIDVSVSAWFVQSYHLLAKADFGSVATALLTAAGVVLCAVGYVAWSRKREDGEDNSASPRSLILLGSLITLGAVFPVVLANRSLDLMDPYKSYGLHPSAGAILILLGVAMAIQPKYRKVLLIAVLGLSVATQSLNTQDWANYWDQQKNFWWQLTWRAPDIRDNTLVMGLAQEGYSFQQDYEVWGPINLIYRQDRALAPMIHSEVLNTDTILEVFEKNSYPTLYVRDIFIPRDYQNLLVISQPGAGACIHVIDGSMPTYSSNERLIVQKVGEYSNLDLIDTSVAQPMPPAVIFGAEPEHGWCYYYQQAALARQKGDWSRIGELYDAVKSVGLEPGDRYEYLVFIEGLANLGREDDAKTVANTAMGGNAYLKFSLCESLSAAPVKPQPDGYRQDAIAKIVCEAPVE